MKDLRGVDEHGGLRERKKRRTRRTIADVAMRLFMSDGFDRVTVDAIAAAADVSPKTVYNYFPSKADLVFDEIDEILAGLLAAVRDRNANESALAAVGRFLARRQPENRPAGPSTAFRRLIDESLALRAARREMFNRLETALAGVLAEETGAAPNAIEPFVAAVALVGVFRSRFELPSDASTPEAVQAELRQRARRALALLDSGLGHYAMSS